MSVLDLVPDHDQQEGGRREETTPVEIDDQTEEKTHDVEVPQDRQMSMPDFGTGINYSAGKCEFIEY